MDGPLIHIVFISDVCTYFLSVIVQVKIKSVPFWDSKKIIILNWLHTFLIKTIHFENFIFLVDFAVIWGKNYEIDT